MKNEILYQDELINIYCKIHKCYDMKIRTLQCLRINYYLNRFVKLNKKTHNKNIDEIINIIGEIKISYEKNCEKNNYYIESYINDKIKQVYSKLSLKSLKIKTKKSNIKQKGLDLNIEYNSDKGVYEITYLNNGEKLGCKQYKLNNIKNISLKRKKVLQKLKKQNYGISVFEELGLDSENAYRINPHIIQILLNEGKIDYAKMYIKEVVSGEPIHKPFKIKYVLNRDVNKGVFSANENRKMKKMAKADRISSSIVNVSNKKKKEIVNNFKTNLLVFQNINKKELSINAKNIENKLDKGILYNIR